MDSLVAEYDEVVLHGNLVKYLSLSKGIGGIVKEQAELVFEAFRAQRELIALASKHKKPADDVLQTLLKPTVDKLLAAQNLRERHRTSEFFNHLSAVSESITILGWVIVTPDPSKYVKELHGAGAYFGHKVIVAYKNKDPTHSDWANAWLNAILDLHSYIFANHRCGLQWNMKGPVATINSSPASAGGLPPPPPPPPPPELFDTSTISQNADSDVRAALFKEINQGAGITKCLKKSDKGSSQLPKNPLQTPVRTTCGKSTQIAKPPRCELDGRKWCVEYQQKNNLKISDCSMNQSVCIYQCHNCVIQVENKVNCITLDSCKKTSIVFADIVSFVEFINCQDMKAQAMGKVPTITIDKTDGFQIFLADSSLDADIISSKSSELNICVPTDDGDFKEFAVPEQFKITVHKKVLKTEVIEKM